MNWLSLNSWKISKGVFVCLTLTNMYPFFSFGLLSFMMSLLHFRHPQLNGDFRSVTSSQTTTEPEDSSFAEGEGEGLGGGDSGQPAHPNVASQGAEGSDYPKPLDPALLQVLSFAANLTLQEEEDTLGKV